MQRQSHEQLASSQEIIKRKLSEFLRLTRTRNADALITILKAGHCYGFSICHAAMGAIGKLDWWKEALAKIAQWDGTLLSLNTSVTLPGTYNKSNPKLIDIFNKVLDYIISCQPSLNELTDYSNFPFTQYDILDPNKKFFELLLDDKRIDTISSLATASGYLKKEHLSALLQEHETQHVIFIINNSTHCIRVGYNTLEQRWFIYDSSDQTKLNDKLYKSFDTKDQFIDDIVKILGNTLHLERATLTYSTPTLEHESIIPTYFENLTTTKPAQLLHELGLHIIAIRNPMWLDFLLIQLIKNKTSFILLSKALTRLNHNNDNGIDCIAENRPTALHYIFDIATLYPECRPHIQFALNSRKSTGSSTLDTIAHYAPDQLQRAKKLLRNYHVPSLTITHRENTTSIKPLNTNHDLVAEEHKASPHLFFSTIPTNPHTETPDLAHLIYKKHH